ncbi:MAG: VWA domain-containing protein [Saprospiraceae bacterium]|nr:VWA domain-containing protein [Saprospiraceae bacterium]
MRGWQFREYDDDDRGKSPFERLLAVFQDLLLYTSGDVAEAIAWLTELDKEYELTTEDYGIADFIQDLIDQGFLQQNDERNGMSPTRKMEMNLRRRALDDIFGSIQKSKRGNHSTQRSGRGDEHTNDIRPYQFGDALDNLAISESLKNAQINHGLDEFKMDQDDLEVRETYYQSQVSTVLMIDISHSMILYGEDRITPAKKVAMALSEFITTRFPKDTLDILVFGDDAWTVEIKDLPYLEVGPYHTNTVAGLELAMKILRRRRNPNKQVFMITDGKPTCIKKGKKYYKNSFGLDKQIINRTLNLASRFRKMNIPITTFMIARDPYLVRFVDHFTQANNGKAFYSSLDGLGEFIFMDYKDGKRRQR